MGDDHDSWLNYLGIDLGKFFSAPATTETDSSNKATPAGGGLPISKPVGKGVKNNAEDVKIVQAALNRKTGAGLAVDGKCQKQTIAAIKAFQKSLGMSKPDGRVDPGKSTAKALASASSPLPPGDPGLPGKIDLSFRSPKPPVQANDDSEADDSGNLLDRIVKGVEDLVDDVIQPKSASGSDEELDFGPEVIAKVTDRIIAKLKSGGNLKAEIQVLEGTSMRGLLEALTKLKNAKKLGAFTAHVKAENRRIGAAVLTIQPEFNDVWWELVSALSPKDREAILERTPESEKRAWGFPEEPAGPGREEDDEDPAEGKVTVDKVVAVEASLAFNTRKGNIGETQFTVKLDPSDKLQIIGLELTLLELKRVNYWGLFGDFVEMDASLSLSADVELTQEQTKTVFEGVRKEIKAQVKARLRRVPALKRVSLNFFVTGGAEGVQFGPALEIAIPRR